MENKNQPNKLHYLLHSSALVEKQLSAMLLPLGLGPRQARVIDALDRIGSASQIDLARECGITAASMSTMTTRLITAGYISRETDPNQLRRNTLRLSKHGLALLKDIKKTWAEVDGVIEKSIGVEKAATLSNLALELRNALGGHTPRDNKHLND